MIVTLSLYILQHGLKHLLCDWHYAGGITMVNIVFSHRMFACCS